MRGVIVRTDRVEAIDARQPAAQVRAAEQLGERAEPVVADQGRGIDGRERASRELGEGGEQGAPAAAVATTNDHAPEARRRRGQIGKGTVDHLGRGQEPTERDGRGHSRHTGLDIAIDGQPGEQLDHRGISPQRLERRVATLDPQDPVADERTVGLELAGNVAAAQRATQELPQQLLIAARASRIVGEDAVGSRDLAP